MVMAKPILRAAVVQAASVIFDAPRALAKLVSLTERAAVSGAQIIGPDDSFLGSHRVLVEPNFGGERTHFANLDHRISTRGKYDLDVIGHYARPDIFNLTVDTRPKRPLCSAAETLEGTSFSCQPHTIAEATQGSQRC
jgi:hypothetical protein